jgi:hypothetical protein
MSIKRISINQLDLTDKYTKEVKIFSWAAPGKKQDKKLADEKNYGDLKGSK